MYRRKVEKAAKVRGKEAVTSSGPRTCKPLDGSLAAFRHKPETTSAGAAAKEKGLKSVMSHVAAAAPAPCMAARARPLSAEEP